MSILLHRLLLVLAFAPWISCQAVSESVPAPRSGWSASVGSQATAPGATEVVPGTAPASEDEIIQSRASFRKEHRFPPENNTTDAAQSRKVRLLYEIDITLSEQIDAIRKLATLELEIENEQPPEKWEEVASIPDVDSSASHINLKRLDILYTIRNNMFRNGERARKEIRRADRNLDLATQSYARTEKQRMDFEDLNGADESTGSIVTDRETATLASQAAEEKLALCRLQSRLTQVELALIENKIDRFKPFVAMHQLKVIVSPQQMQEQLADFSTKEAELERSLLDAQEAFVQRALDVSGEVGLSGVEEGPQETTQKLVQSYGLRAAHERVSLNQLWINHLNVSRQFYEHRVIFYQNKIERRQISEIAKELDLEIKRLESDKDDLKNRIEQAEQDAERIGDQFEGSDGYSDQLIQALGVAAGEIVEMRRLQALSIESTLSRLRNFSDEVHGRTFGYSWSEIKATLEDRLPLVWSHQIFIINDKAFRVSTLFWLVLLVTSGFFAAGLISRRAGYLLTSKTRIAPGVSAAYEKLIFYLLVIIICVFIFNLFNFSLTSLAVVSGALALAVGFGSQEVLKNFISGIILLVERPVHEGDLIELEGQILKVESIGLRSTRILGYDNSQKIVPNNVLLGNIITNWTLSDNILRTTIPVGVAYGSPTRKTSEVLLEATRSTGGVLSDPEPFVLLNNFDDNALGFIVYFWTRAVERLVVSSEARHRIMEALNAENITIAFPQQDVHVDSLHPIRVEWSRATRAETSKEPHAISSRVTPHSEPKSPDLKSGI